LHGDILSLYIAFFKQKHYIWNMNQANEFSFVLKPSTVEGAGVGVFATQDIPKGSQLALHTEDHSSRRMRESDIPKELLDLCVAEEGGWYKCPEQFNHVEIGWYVNHSDRPNIGGQHGKHVALHNIKAGEELFMNYNVLHEPESKKEEFYT
jgi:SET domain-containing protein